MNINEICSLEAEQAVLSCFIRYHGCYLQNSEKLSKSDFINETHQLIFDAIGKYFIGQNNHDIVEIMTHILSSGKIEPNYLASICQSTISESNIERYMLIVRDRSVRRKIIESFNSLIPNITNIEMPINSVCAEVEEAVYQLSSLREQKKDGLRDTIAQFYEEIEEAQRNGGDICGIKSGFFALDQATQGFRNENLIIIAGRPGMGKTSFALNMFENFVFHEKKTVMLFSLEMSALELVKRLISSQTSINQYTLNTGKLLDSCLERITRVTGKLLLHDEQIIIDDSSSLSPATLRAKVRRQALIRKPDVLIVDYLQLMSSEIKTSNTTEQITHISRELKKIAKEFKVPVIALSQLNRGVENRPAGTPQLSDLRGSGSIEQDADQVIFVHREKENQGEADVILAKNRHGKTDNIILKFTPSITKFANREATTYDYYDTNY